MTLADLKSIDLLQTRSIAEACSQEREGGAETLAYIVQCLNRFYSGDYGEVPPEDTEANNSDLAEGYGHILARYKQAHNLTGDIYIETHIDKDHTGDIDYNTTMIMYPEER